MPKDKMYRSVGANLNTGNLEDLRRLELWDAWKKKRRSVDVIRWLIDTTAGLQEQRNDQSDLVLKLLRSIESKLESGTLVLSQPVNNIVDTENLVSLDDVDMFV